MKKILLYSLALFITITSFNITQAFSFQNLDEVLSDPTKSREEKVYVLNSVLTELKSELMSLVDSRRYTGEPDPRMLVFADSLKKAIETEDLGVIVGLFSRQEDFDITEFSFEEAEYFLVDIVRELESGEYSYVVEDNKHLVVHGAIRDGSDTSRYTVSKGVFFMSKQKDGSLKMERFLTSAKTDLLGGERENSLVRAQNRLSFVDTDGDGISDKDEMCVDDSGNQKNGCVKTDPYNRDTNNDGVWDSFGI